jgi:DNA-binding YbaB/EbfC family protein
MEKEIEDLLAQVHAHQERVLDVQRAVDRMEITAAAGDGDVTVRLRGTGRVIEIVIDPQAMRRYDAQELGAVVADAVNDGVRRLGEASRQRFAPMLGRRGLSPARTEPGAKLSPALTEPGTDRARH